MLLAVIQEVRSHAGCVGDSCYIGDMINGFLITIDSVNLLAVLISALLYYRCLAHEKLLSLETGDSPYNKV